MTLCKRFIGTVPYLGALCKATTSDSRILERATGSTLGTPGVIPARKSRGSQSIQSLRSSQNVLIQECPSSEKPVLQPAHKVLVKTSHSETREFGSVSPEWTARQIRLFVRSTALLRRRRPMCPIRTPTIGLAHPTADEYIAPRAGIRLIYMGQ
jgi:hypothetical protein